MATAKLPSLSPHPQPTITTDQISRYAEIASILSELEAQQKTLRIELLQLHASGAEQETDSPYLLNFVDQERRTVDWKGTRCNWLKGSTAWRKPQPGRPKWSDQRRSRPSRRSG